MSLEGNAKATMGEIGWWKDKLYKSKVNGNVYNPDVYPANWEDATL